MTIWNHKKGSGKEPLRPHNKLIGRTGHGDLSTHVQGELSEINGQPIYNRKKQTKIIFEFYNDITYRGNRAPVFSLGVNLNLGILSTCLTTLDKFES